MISDIRVAVSFLTHRKRKKLKMLLGPGSTDYILDLWINTAMNRPSGVLEGMDEMDIAIDSGWDGEPGVFVQALLSVGFLDQREDGAYELHDWQEHQTWVTKSSDRSENARRAAKTRWDKNAGRNADLCEPHAERNAHACEAQCPYPFPSLPKTTPPPPPSEGIVCAGDDFERFFKAYPKRRSKGEAERIWRRLEKAGELPPLTELLEAVEAASRNSGWLKENGRYIPRPGKWLEDKCWLDVADELATRRRAKEQAEQEAKALEAWRKSDRKVPEWVRQRPIAPARPISDQVAELQQRFAVQGNA